MTRFAIASGLSSLLFKPCELSRIARIVCRVMPAAI
jgi:hypothetical protein